MNGRPFAHVTLSWPCRIRREASLLSFTVGSKEQIRDGRSLRNWELGLSVSSTLSALSYTGSLGKPSAYVWPSQRASPSHQPSTLLGPVSLLSCDPGKLPSSLCFSVCEGEQRSLLEQQQHDVPSNGARLAQVSKLLAHCPSIAGSPGFLEPTWSGSSMRRMAVRPTAFSGGSGAALWGLLGWRRPGWTQGSVVIVPGSLLGPAVEDQG